MRSFVITKNDVDNVIKLISGTLFLFTAYMYLKHGWQAIYIKPGDTFPEVELFNKLSPVAIKAVDVLSILGGLLNFGSAKVFYPLNLE